MKRPMVNGMAQVTTPRAEQVMKLLGSATTYKSLVLTHDEFNAVKRLYGFKKELPNKKPDPPKPPSLVDLEPWKHWSALQTHEDAVKAHDRWEDPRPLMQAGADRNTWRTAEADGLRLVAWIAKFVPPGEDPLAHLIQAVAGAGWDVDPEDIKWAHATETEQ